MPWQIKGRCYHWGCIERAVVGSLCARHHTEKQERDAVRNRQRAEEWKQAKLKTDPEFRERNRFYLTQAWKRLRRMKLAEEPLCRTCGAPAKVVDHIKQISRGGERHDMNNLQSLCTPCHDRKRVRETVKATKERAEEKKRNKSVG